MESQTQEKFLHITDKPNLKGQNGNNVKGPTQPKADGWSPRNKFYTLSFLLMRESIGLEMWIQHRSLSYPWLNIPLRKEGVDEIEPVTFMSR